MNDNDDAYALGEPVTYRGGQDPKRDMWTVVSVNGDGTFDVELALGLAHGVPKAQRLCRREPGGELGKVRVIRR